MKLIDKEPIVAEIDERIKAWKEHYDDMHDAECHELATGAYLRIDELKDFKKFLNSIEVKNVDLEKEFYKYMEKVFDPKTNGRPTEEDMLEFAKHFFELGLKVKQG